MAILQQLLARILTQLIQVHFQLRFFHTRLRQSLIKAKRPMLLKFLTVQAYLRLRGVHGNHLHWSNTYDPLYIWVSRQLT